MKVAEKDRLLFMKYAVPCAGTLVSRRTISGEKWNELVEAVKIGRIPAESERIFKVAFAACSLLAIDMGKKEIDREVINRYYLFEHDAMIDKRYEEMRDFNTAECRIRPGTVKSVGNDFAVVENSIGSRKYRTDYCPVVTGDLVTTHWDFVVEKISKETAEKMKRQKIELKVI